MSDSGDDWVEIYSLSHVYLDDKDICYGVRCCEINHDVVDGNLQYNLIKVESGYIPTNMDIGEWKRGGNLRISFPSKNSLGHPRISYLEGFCSKYRFTLTQPTYRKGTFSVWEFKMGPLRIQTEPVEPAPQDRFNVTVNNFTTTGTSSGPHLHWKSDTK